MTTRHVVRTGVMAIATSAIVCACGSPAVTPPPSTQASPTPTPTPFVSSKFTTIVPKEWTDQTGNQTAVASISAGGTVLMLLYSPHAQAGLNEHIDVSLASQSVPDDQLAQYLQSVGQSGATNVSQTQSFALDGATGVYITYNLVSSGGMQLKDQDMVVNHGGDTYDIVLNTATIHFADQLTVLQAVLAAWKWK